MNSASDREILGRLRRKARRLAADFRLKRHRIEQADPRTSLAGSCSSEGEILIRLHRLNTRRRLSHRWLLDTLCHELAHLRHMDHGRKFRQLHREILDRARGGPSIIPTITTSEWPSRATAAAMRPGRKRPRRRPTSR